MSPIMFNKLSFNPTIDKGGAKKLLVAIRNHLERVELGVLIIFSSGCQRVERQDEVLLPRRFETIGRHSYHDVLGGCPPPRLDSLLRPNLPISINGLHDRAIRAQVCRFLPFQIESQLYKTCVG